MEIILGSLIDWIHKTLAKRSFWKWALSALVFGLGWWFAYIQWAY
jgi:hypothetical protein